MEQQAARGPSEGQRSDYKLKYYGILRVSNPDGTIKFGAFDVPLFNPPIKMTANNPLDRVKESIKISITHPTASAAAGKREV